MFVNDDFLNANNGVMDPRHWFGTSNFDVFRWPSLENGTLRSALGSFITNLVMPGIPLVGIPFHLVNFSADHLPGLSGTMGRSRTFICLIPPPLTISMGKHFPFVPLDTTNASFRRQAMVSNKAWQRHGCYKVGSDQYFNIPVESAIVGCMDDWNSLDHFDPTTDMRRLTKQFMYLRSVYNALQDGFNLVQRGNWTYQIQRPGSNGTATEMGLWSVSRAGIPGVQTLAGNHTDQVWLLYSNLNTSFTWSYDCKSSLWISSPYQSGTTVRNLLAPYENYTLADSGSSYYANGTAPYYGCMNSITLDPYGMKVLVPDNEWVAPPPTLTGFLPGHDARIQTTPGSANATTLNLLLEFNLPMSCDSVTNSLTFNMSSSGIGGQPTLDAGSIECAAVTNPVTSTLAVAPPSTWSWSATLTNVPDGVLEIIVNRPTTADGTANTGVSLICFSGFDGILMLLIIRSLSTISLCARARQIMSWSSQCLITTIRPLHILMDSISLRTRHMVRIC